MFDVTAIGELLIDMAQLGMSDIGSPIFEANPGARRAMFWQCSTSSAGAQRL